MSSTSAKPTPRSFMFKASWRGTSLSFWIEAPSKGIAWKRAKRKVSKMEGFPTLIDLFFMKEKETP